MGSQGKLWITSLNLHFSPGRFRTKCCTGLAQALRFLHRITLAEPVGLIRSYSLVFRAKVIS
jgi:hypothetical protein